MVDRLKDKVTLVTGGSRGQGAAEAELFAAEGARVIIADVLDDDGAQTAAAIGDAASYHHLDVTDEDAWHALVADIVDQHGRLDALVNNAGIYRNAPIVEMTQDMYRQVIEINQIGVWLGMKAVGPQMMAQQAGSVVNISSTAGFRGGPGSIAYTASKFAVRGMTKVAAREWGRYNIRVNSIHPGPIDTMML
ncbi:MAG: SDR family NAD(P)-dependent oxidoreductase, partial [Chloroflexi bacterium]|nr:SDR family NAD(P)-dependent oxidoreductase [Chloroflexota bacterium]